MFEALKVSFEEQKMEITSYIPAMPKKTPQPTEEHPTIFFSPAALVDPDGVAPAQEVQTTGLLPLPLQKMPVLANGRTHPGIKRAHKPNEDSFFQMVMTSQPASQSIPQARGLFLVADGMGGYDDGLYASRRTINRVSSAMAAALYSASADSKTFAEQFAQVVRQANTELCHENVSQRVSRGTTLTGVALMEQVGSDTASYVAHIVNVGDSRTYRYVPGKGLYRITRDHSTVELLIAQGVITPEERYTDRRRNQIYRSLGHQPEMEVDVFSVTLQAGERLLLCSDGLWEMVRDPALAAYLAQPNVDPSLITGQLIQAALDGGGHDNITAVVVSLPSETEIEPTTDAHESLYTQR